MVDLVGHQLGNYRLIRLLKRDAFGDVYLGQHVHVHRLQAAVKVLRANVRSEYQELFLQEAETIAGLRHPHIIRILDFGIDRDNAPYPIMDYTSQETLRSRHPKGSIVSLMTVIAYVKQIAEALQYIHDHHVVHRDLQPGSLIVGDNGDILLSDFGFSIAAERLEKQGEGETFMVGLTSWPPPEQMIGQACFASDQYALGAVVYEWLCGERHYTFKSVDDLLKQIMQGLPIPLREKVPTLSPTIEQVVMKALAKDPQQRFPSVRDFAAALEQACQHKYYPYDIALSYAGEDREKAEALVAALRRRGVKVFYDQNEKSTLWGKNLYSYLSDLYKNKARYCLMLLSYHYATKRWTKHELKSAQARVFIDEHEDYILPVRIDNTEIPGILETTAYLNWHTETAETITDAILAKLYESRP